jgi:hypothetical protein
MAAGEGGINAREAASTPQLPLFVSESSVAQDVLARYEAIRPVLTGERPLRVASPVSTDVRENVRVEFS